MRRLFCLCLCFCLLSLPAQADGILDGLRYFGTPEDDQPVGLCRLSDGRLAAGYNACGDGQIGYLALLGQEGEIHPLEGGALQALCAVGDKLALLLRDGEGASRLKLLAGPELAAQAEAKVPFSAEGMAVVEDALVICGSAMRAEGDTCGVIAIYDADGNELDTFYHDVAPATGFTCVAPTETGFVTGGWKEMEEGRAALMVFYTGSHDGQTAWEEYQATGEHAEQSGSAVYTRVVSCPGGAIGLGSLIAGQERARTQGLACRVDGDGRQEWRCAAGGTEDSFFTDAVPYGSGWILVGQYQDGEPPATEEDARGAWLYQLSSAGESLTDFSIFLDVGAFFSAILAEEDTLWVLGQSNTSSLWGADEWGGGGMDIFLAQLSQLQKREFRLALGE